MAKANAKVEALIKALKANKYAKAAKSVGIAEKLIEKCGPEIGDVVDDLAALAVIGFSAGKNKERMRQLCKVICGEILIGFLADAES